MATFDMVNLCTNIPHVKGEDVVRYWLAKCKSKVGKGDSPLKEAFIIVGQWIIFKWNVFYFSGKLYKQNMVLVWVPRMHSVCKFVHAIARRSCWTD